MPSSDKDWFPPGFRSILELVEEIGREIHGGAYWPDNPPKDFNPPQMAGTSYRLEPATHQSGAGAPEGEGDTGEQSGAKADPDAIPVFHERWYLADSWWDQCEQHRQPARDQLRTKLAAGEIEAFVLSSVHGDVPIPANWWRGEAAIKALRSGKADLSNGVVVLGKASISPTASGPVGVKTRAEHTKPTLRAEAACRSWLARELRSGRHRAKNEYRQAAQASIPNLSAGAFGHVWRALAREPGNGWMSQAGRKKSKGRIDSVS